MLHDIALYKCNDDIDNDIDIERQDCTKCSLIVSQWIPESDGSKTDNVAKQKDTFSCAMKMITNHWFLYKNFF